MDESTTDPVPHSEKIVRGTTDKTVRDAQSEGGRAGTGKSKQHRQRRGSALTPLGTLWSQVRTDWLTGAFSQRSLAAAHGLDVATLRHRLNKEQWGDRPMADQVQPALPGLVEAISFADPDGERVESIIAATEGRPVDPDALFEEKASSMTQRKALVIRNHREVSDRYYKLALAAIQHLEDYSNGKMTISTVRAVDPEGKSFNLPFHLLSKQHGLMDGIQKVGSVLEQAIKLQRHSHGLEGVDGDGNKRPPGSGGGIGGLNSKTDDELAQAISSLMTDLRSGGRETPLPPGLAPRA